MSTRANFTLAGGLLQSDGACHREGWLRPLNGFDEEWIHALTPSTSRAVFVTGLLARCVRRIGGRKVTREMLRELTVGDRDQLMLRLYQASFGDRLSLVLTCPREGCGAKLDLDLRVEDIPVEERALQASYWLRLGGAEPVEIEFRLPRGGDQERLASSGGLKEGEAHDRLLDACVLSGPWPAWGKEALTAAIEERAPRVESEVEVTCPECGHPFDAELDPITLLLQEVERGRTVFDRELHLLAFHYHWPLGELYSLPRSRRQRFLQLLLDELGAEGG
jgi:hypothetical protein